MFQGSVSGAASPGAAAPRPLVNASGAARRVEVRSAAVDLDGRTVARRTSTTDVADTGTSDQQLSVRTPVLWSCEHPHRYTLHTELRVDGRTTDTYRTPFGIRQVVFDADDGMTLTSRHPGEARSGLRISRLEVPPR
ncbi:hypothetical protein [Streptomyces tauricus]